MVKSSMARKKYCRLSVLSIPLTTVVGSLCSLLISCTVTLYSHSRGRTELLPWDHFMLPFCMYRTGRNDLLSYSLYLITLVCFVISTNIFSDHKSCFFIHHLVATYHMPQEYWGSLPEISGIKTKN